MAIYFQLRKCLAHLILSRSISNGGDVCFTARSVFNEIHFKESVHIEHSETNKEWKTHIIAGSENSRQKIEKKISLGKECV